MSADRGRLRRLAGEATDGPWYVATSDGGFQATCITAEVGSRRPVDCCGETGCGPITRRADAEFIAAARDAVPALLDLLDRCETTLAGLTECRCRPAVPPGGRHSIACTFQRKAAAEQAHAVLAELRAAS